MLRKVPLAAIVALSLAAPPAAIAEDTDIEDTKSIYVKMTREMAKSCAEVWSIKDTGELDKFEKQQNGLLNGQEQMILQQFNEAASNLESDLLEFRESDKKLNRSVVTAIEEFAKTGGEMDTGSLKEFGKSLNAGGSAGSAALKAEGNLAISKKADLKIAATRERLLRATISLRLVNVMRKALKACVAGQRNYLTGKTDDEQPPPVAGWQGQLAQDVELSCEQGKLPPEKNKTWKDQARIVIEFEAPQAQGGSAGKGSIDYGGASHDVLAFATADGTFSATGQVELRSFQLIGNLERGNGGRLKASGQLKISIDTSGKIPGIWLGTLCEANFFPP